MKKIIITQSLFFFSLFICGYLFYESWRADMFTCIADVDFTVNTKNTSARLDSDYDFIIGRSSDASIHVNGLFYVGENKYEINRTYFFNYLKSKGDVLYTMNFVRREVHSPDNAPSEIYENLFLPQSKNAPYFIKIQHLRNDLYLIEGLKRTYFTCQRQ
ncbi:hypothetical protein EAG21025_42960 (plasmid) [Enterobacter asburiae]|uniref:hypothetical protein n=1 Tax=Enterobacter asburiae TaxID=61645 RepID=UPI0034E8D57A|nr:hypothetical protein [Enterobacter asburiae]